MILETEILSKDTQVENLMTWPFLTQTNVLGSVTCKDCTHKLFNAAVIKRNVSNQSNPSDELYTKKNGI